MLTFYIDGQSLGNEKAESIRRAKLTIAFRPEASPGQGTTLRILVEDIGNRTNNEAEYDALLRLLRLLSATMKPTQQLRICSDSEVLVKQLSGEYKVREERLRKLWHEAKELMEKTGVTHLEQVPREKNLAGLWLERRIEGREMRPEEFLSGL